MRRAAGAAAEWRRTEAAVVVAVFLYFAGTSFVVPFLPLYVVELDGFDIPTAALWSGLILAAAPLVSGIVAPLWGRLSDRFGQKILLQRSLLGFTISLGLMGIVTASAQLLLIRALMGLVGGFSVTAQAMVSIRAPKGGMAGAIGRTNAARVLGMAIGPIPGGILADAFGIRVACLASVAGGVAALAVVTVLIPRHGPSATSNSRAAATATRVFTPGFASLLVVVTTVRMVEKSFDPVLPLIIQSLDDRPLGAGAATAIASSVGLLAAAAGSAGAGRVEPHLPGARRRNLSILLIVTACIVVTTFFATSLWPLVVLRAVSGLLLGVIGSLAIVQVARSTPLARRGAAMGLVGSGTAFGSAFGLLGAGLLGAVALPAVFLVDGVLLAGSSVIQRLWGPAPDGDDDAPAEASS